MTFFIRSLHPPIYSEGSILKPQMFAMSPSGNSAGLAQLSWSTFSRFSSTAIVLLLRCHWRHVSNAKYGQMALWMKETNTSSMILKNSQIVTTEWKLPNLGILQQNEIRKFHKLQQIDNHRTWAFWQKYSRFMKLQPLPSMLYKSGSRFLRTWYCNTKLPFWLAQYPLLAYCAVTWMSITSILLLRAWLYSISAEEIASNRQNLNNQPIR
jgi:hypothetical protein